MNYLIASFFVVITGTQAPVGFNNQDSACIYAETRPKAKMYGWFSGPTTACYAVEDGCSRADRDNQAKGIQMLEITCGWREEKRRVREVKFK